MMAPLFNLIVVALSVVAYIGAAGVAWTCFQRTCATVFIHNITFFTSVAVGFSTAAALMQIIRWLAFRTMRERRCLLFSAAPAVGAIAFWFVSLAVVFLTAPNKALHPTRAAEPHA